MTQLTSRPSFRTSLVALCLLPLTVLLVGCTPSASGGPVNKSAQKASRRARTGAGARKAAVQSQRIAGMLGAGVAGGRAGVMASLESADGYIVKGTDFQTFWPCQKSGYYYMMVSPAVNGRIAQQYKFSVTRPYSPMFAQVRLRYVDDTLTVGQRHFTRYAQVMDYTQRDRSEATCPSPRREILSDEMQRLDNFRTDVFER